MKTEEGHKSPEISDKHSFERLFREEYQRLCNYAMTFIHDADRSEEVVQDVFVKLWEKKDSMVVRSSVRSYLFRAIRNACLNQLRHDKVRRMYVEEKTALESEAVEVVSTNELEEQIQLALESLPPQCKRIFLMSRFEKKSYQEIAVELDLSIKTVENQMGKALRMLRIQLKDYLPFLLLFIFNNN